MWLVNIREQYLVGGGGGRYQWFLFKKSQLNCNGIVPVWHEPFL